MARTLNRKEITKRIFNNKKVMNLNKKFVIDSMNDMVKGEMKVEVSTLRAALSDFIFSSTAIVDDLEKLSSIE